MAAVYRVQLGELGWPRLGLALRDGWALCLLVHHYAPQLVGVRASPSPSPSPSPNPNPNPHQVADQFPKSDPNFPLPAWKEAFMAPADAARTSLEP